MTKLFWKVFKLSPLVVAATFCATNSANSAEVNAEVTSVTQLSQTDSMSQVTSVSQFSDVQPTDWAFQALQSLVERYGCIAGYPNGTYRGNRAMTRYEFAAGLNACLDRVNELIATATADLVTKEDLATLQRLQEEFSAELATLRGRVDALEARSAELEANQFSTTTKLIGEAIFALSDSFADNAAISAATLRSDPNAPDRDLESNTTLSERIRLNLLSSFTGKDQLQIRLQVGNILANNSSNPNIGNASTGTNMARLIFENNTDNNLQAEKINYAFNLSDAIRVKVDANNGEFWENINSFSPLFASTSQGAISRYGRFSPIYRQGQGGAGATISFNANGPLSASVGYLAGGRNNTAKSPLDRDGLFDGNYAALAQIGFQPTKAFNVGLTYVRTYQNGVSNVNGVNSGGGVSLFEFTGSSIANNPFGNVATTGNHYGVQASFRLTSNLLLNGWYGYTEAEAQNTANSTVTGVPITVSSGDSATFNYWGASLGLQDIGTKGSVLGFIFGQPPRTTSNDANVTSNGRGLRDTDTSYHLEGLYKFRLNDNIAITPGLLVILSPEHNDRNDTIYVGTLRTTFSF